MTNNDPLGIENTLANTHVRRLRGKQTILDHQSMLQDFAAITGQHAAMHGLRFKLEHRFVQRKTPNLFCVVAGQDASSSLTLDSLLGCVLLFEYRAGSWNTGMFATGDSAGIGTVIAPAKIRADVATLASSEALCHGRLVLTCFRNQFRPRDVPEIVFPPGQQACLWTAQLREVRDCLALSPTYDLTLHTLGKRTRNHMRYYRRRVETQTGCVFVPDAASHIAQSDLAFLNTSSLEPVGQREFDLQFNAAAQLPGGFVCGLRAADGRWLCLAGGWRQGGTSLIQWQMNTSGFPRLSLSTAFRAVLIQHEVDLGTSLLFFQGGTRHSISHAFLEEHAVNLILRKPGALLSLLVWALPHFARRDIAFANRGNFLIDALRTHPVHWKSLSQAAVVSRVGTCT